MLANLSGLNCPEHICIVKTERAILGPRNSSRGFVELINEEAVNSERFNWGRHLEEQCRQYLFGGGINTEYNFCRGVHTVTKFGEVSYDIGQQPTYVC